jgi:serine phosphatase RsbU (regulator of sigma subunit)
MSDSFNTMANAVMLNRQMIEQQVTERTTQLHRANHEIRLLNDQLHLENRRLGSELAVSRRLQSMLLPSDEELMAFSVLDVVGMMTPSQEVGGDYYDVFQANECVIIGIGDVTGHGLESGVLAMMVQTAVRSLLTQSSLSLAECLIAVNQTVYFNAQRLHTDRTLSLALLAYHPETARLTITGQHESVLLVQNGALIELDTFDLGFPIGLEPDIRDYTQCHECQLALNDVVVLYTDGITEAEDTQHHYYGLDRLKAVVHAFWQQPAMAIKQAILKDVWEFIGEEQDLLDDITLVVLKRVE